MRISQTILIATLALTLQFWNSGQGAAHGASPTSAQILQRSMRAMRSVHSAHTQSSLHLAGRIAGGTTSEVITAHTSVDCTGTRTATHFRAAIRAAIRGTFVLGKGLPQSIKTHYILLESGSSTGANAQTSLWERDTTQSNRWRRVPAVSQGAAYVAFFNAEQEACPADVLALRVAQTGHLRPETTAKTSGRPVWVLRGTSGNPVSGLFSFRILVHRDNDRVGTITLNYLQRVYGRVVVQQHIATTYSRYGASFAIKAPVAGSRTP